MGFWFYLEILVNGKAEEVFSYDNPVIICDICCTILSQKLFEKQYFFIGSRKKKNWIFGDNCASVLKMKVFMPFENVTIYVYAKTHRMMKVQNVLFVKDRWSGIYLLIRKPKCIQSYLGGIPRDIQRWARMFQRFDLSQRSSALIQKTWKRQRWWALFQTWSALTLSESALLKTESALILTHVNENNKLW